MTQEFNTDISNLDALSEQDMLAIAHQMNAIEPGAGANEQSFMTMIIDALPSPELLAGTVLLAFGIYAGLHFARKTRLYKLIRS